MSAIPFCDDILPADESVASLPDVATVLGLPVARVQQLLRENKLIAVRRADVICVPEKFLGTDGQPIKHLPGVLAVLLDGGYDHQAILRWLFTADDSLPGQPIDILRSPQAREVVRRAQAMAF